MKISDTKHEINYIFSTVQIEFDYFELVMQVMHTRGRNETFFTLLVALNYTKACE